MEYLNALQSTDDELRANSLLRNGISHVEASAFDRRGVNEAMEQEQLIQVDAEELQMREMVNSEQKRNEREELEDDIEHEVMALDNGIEEERIHPSDDYFLVGTNPTRQNDGDAVDIGSHVAALLTPAKTIMAHTIRSITLYIINPRQDEKLDLSAWL